MPQSRDLADRLFWVAKESEVKKGETTDIYFRHTVNILKKTKLDPKVTMEIYARKLPYEGRWGVVTGIYEVAKLLEGYPLDVDSMDEGEVFIVNPDSVIYEPVLQITGPYQILAPLENPILGLLCSSTGVSTKAARVKKAAGKKLVFSFGTRRAHPILAPMIERSAYIGGFDSVSNLLGARLMGMKPVGTMPHALILCFGSQIEAWKAYDRTMPKDAPRILLVDSLYDEKTEALMAYELLGKRLKGIRLDTPSSRRGDFKKILQEVRWELNLRGGREVKIYASGSLDEDSIRELAESADGFGVGTAVSAAPPIDFSAKIVEVHENHTKFRAKRGDLAGRKLVYRNKAQITDKVMQPGGQAPKEMTPLLTPTLRNGTIVKKFRNLHEIRKEVLRKLELLGDMEPMLKWEASS